MLNIYWSDYKNLENEVFDLTKSIHFCDSQIDTFSIRISELILRIGVEVESISKELFNTQFEVGDKVLMGKENDIEIQYCEDGQWIRVHKSNDGELHDLSFDYNCLKYLEEKWMLSERRVLINSSNIYFKQQKHIVLFPLSTDALTKASTMNDRGGWLKAYQALKHSPTRNLHLGSIHHMIHALGALYILNIYYHYFESGSIIVKDPSNRKILNKPHNSKIFITTIGDASSDIFVPQLNRSIELNVNQEKRGAEAEVFQIHNGTETLRFF